MSADPAQVRVEIFREPTFFDDNFVKGWVNASGTMTTDGEQCTLNGEYYKLASFASSTYTKIAARVTSLVGTGNWHIFIYDGSQWLAIEGDGYTGLHEATIPSGKTVTRIYLHCDATLTVKFDYVAISKYAVLVPDLGDIVNELTITRPRINKGIAGAHFSVPNFSGAYNGLISKHDMVIIWLSRDASTLGDVATKAFGGRVVNPKNRGDGYGAFYIDVDCHSHAYELDVPPALLQEVYAATNGRTIVEDALALCAYLAAHPTASMWFDNAGSSGSSDDRINSTHDVTYDEELPLTVIQEIIEKAENPSGYKGFDVYETPSGVLIGHLRRSNDFVSSITDLVPRSYVKHTDLHRVRNRQTVYGSAGKQQPQDGDSYTESATNWTSDGTITLDNADLVIGVYSILSTRAIGAGNPITTYLRRSLSPTITTDFRQGYKKLHVFVKCSNDPGLNANLTVTLECPDSSNTYIYTLGAIDGEWKEIDVPIGRDSTIWSVGAGAPDWNNIQAIKFLSLVGSVIMSPCNVYLRVDNLFFSGARFSDTADDPTSQGLYAVREAKPEVDDALNTDAECLARAESIVNVLKDPPEIFEDLVIDGSLIFLPGDLQEVLVSNDGVHASYPITQVKHTVKGTVWDSVLTLSEEPQYVDFVFQLHARKMERYIGRF